jgi:hypothetical protein
VGFFAFFSLFSFLLLLFVFFFSADEISCLFGEQLVFRFLFPFSFLFSSRDYPTMLVSFFLS